MDSQMWHALDNHNMSNIYMVCYAYLTVQIYLVTYKLCWCMVQLLVTSSTMQHIMITDCP